MYRLFPILIWVACPFLLAAQTAPGWLQNLEARGGLEKIKAIKTLRMTGRDATGRFYRPGHAHMPWRLICCATPLPFKACPQIQAYDGSSGWQILPLRGAQRPGTDGRRRPARVVEDADFYGPLVDYSAKDNRIEYMGHDTVDGDDAYRVKVTLANGDIMYYFSTPTLIWRFGIEEMEFVRGAVVESFDQSRLLQEGGRRLFPFLDGKRQQAAGPADSRKITLDKIEANVPVNAADFKMPVSPTRPAAVGKEFLICGAASF